MRRSPTQALLFAPVGGFVVLALNLLYNVSVQPGRTTTGEFIQAAFFQFFAFYFVYVFAFILFSPVAIVLDKFKFLNYPSAVLVGTVAGTAFGYLIDSSGEMGLMQAGPLVGAATGVVFWSLWPNKSSRQDENTQSAVANDDSSSKQNEP